MSVKEENKLHVSIFMHLLFHLLIMIIFVLLVVSEDLNTLKTSLSSLYVSKKPLLSFEWITLNNSLKIFIRLKREKKKSVADFSQLAENKSVSHLVAVPAVGHRGPQTFNTNHLQHVFVRGVRGHHLIVRQLVVLHDPWTHTYLLNVSAQKPTNRLRGAYRRLRFSWFIPTFNKQKPVLHTFPSCL